MEESKDEKVQKYIKFRNETTISNLAAKLVLLKNNDNYNQTF